MHYLQSKRIPIESVLAKSINYRMFSHIREECARGDEILCAKRGPCPMQKTPAFQDASLIGTLLLECFLQFDHGSHISFDRTDPCEYLSSGHAFRCSYY